MAIVVRSPTSWYASSNCIASVALYCTKVPSRFHSHVAGSSFGSSTNRRISRERLVLRFICFELSISIQYIHSPILRLIEAISAWYAASTLVAIVSSMTVNPPSSFTCHCTFLSSSLLSLTLRFLSLLLDVVSCSFGRHSPFAKVEVSIEEEFPLRSDTSSISSLFNKRFTNATSHSARSSIPSIVSIDSMLAICLAVKQHKWRHL
mmetsp:Transcript_136977/g.238113  ORF Transcript_136977/g.238113 Transcript_136977/m.238113 type:complete len:206 (-) Transcript_136977:855-1472(-)